MKVQMKTLLAGPSGTAHPGQVVDVSEATGQALVQGGFAEEIIPKPPKSAPEEPETETLTPPENAAGKPGGRQRKPPAKGK